jgi:hypothetical protein
MSLLVISKELWWTNREWLEIRCGFKVDQKCRGTGVALCSHPTSISILFGIFHILYFSLGVVLAERACLVCFHPSLSIAYKRLLGHPFAAGHDRLLHVHRTATVQTCGTLCSRSSVHSDAEGL